MLLFDTICFLSIEYISIKDKNKSLFCVYIFKAATSLGLLWIWKETPSALLFSPTATKNYIAKKCMT